MKKPANLAGLLFVAAAIGLWACQHAARNGKLAEFIGQAITSAIP